MASCVSYIRTYASSGRPSWKAKLRFRPIMTTTTVEALELIPFLFAKGPGSQIQRPLAIVANRRVGKIEAAGDGGQMPLGSTLRTVIVNFEKYATFFRLEGTVIHSRRATGVCGGVELGPSISLLVVADNQIAFH